MTDHHPEADPRIPTEPEAPAESSFEREALPSREPSEPLSTERAAGQAAEPSLRDRLAYFVTVPFRGRTWKSLAYLLLAFPLGLVYFVLLSVGIPLGLGLSLVWIGLPILALVLLTAWGFAAFERQMAIHLLGAEVAPMSPPRPDRRTVLERLGDYFGNPVTWKALAYLLIKLPLGVLTFVVVTVLGSLSLSMIVGPWFYDSASISMISVGGAEWRVDTIPEAFLCMVMGLLWALISLHVFHGVAFLWAKLSEVLLGSESHRVMPSAGAGSLPGGPTGGPGAPHREEGRDDRDEGLAPLGSPQHPATA